MNQPKERNWTEMFAYAPARIEIVTSHKCTCGNGNCKQAKKIRCTCKCHSLHHGETNRVGMEPLDKTLELDLQLEGNKWESLIRRAASQPSHN